MILFTLFLGGESFFYTQKSQVIITDEKDEKINRTIYDVTKENKDTVESEDKGFTDNAEGKIEILPNPDMDNMNIETLPVPDDMEPTYLELDNNKKER